MIVKGKDLIKVENVKKGLKRSGKLKTRQVKEISEKKR